MSYLAAENDVPLFAGASLTLELEVVDENDEAIDITGSTVVMTVKCHIEDELPLIVKSSAVSPAQVDIVSPKEGIAMIYLASDDTKNLDPGEYVFDVWVTLSSGKRYVVVEPASLIIERAVRRLL